MAGLIERSPDANLGMRGLATDFGSWLRNSGAPWGKAFRWSVKIGLTPRRPIAFSPMSASARRTFWPAIFNRLVIARPPLTGLVLVLHDTTEFPIRGRTRRRSASLRRQILH